MKSVRSSRSLLTRGQALAEFAIVIGVMMMLVVTSLQMVPAIAARGIVLDAAANAVERANRFLAPQDDNNSISAASQRTMLCNQLLVVVQTQLRGSGLPVAGATDAGCRSGNPTSMFNPIVNVTTVATPANPGGYLDLRNFDQRRAGLSETGPSFNVCIAYRWQPQAGLLWLISQAPGEISSSIQNSFIYRYCAPGVIDAQRTR